jgi:hypothetical protein
MLCRFAIDKQTINKKKIMNKSDAELESMINFWLDHYIANGDSHYSDTREDIIREIYWDKIIDRVIESNDEEMTEDELEIFVERLNNI